MPRRPLDFPQPVNEVIHPYALPYHAFGHHYYDQQELASKLSLFLSYPPVPIKLKQG